MSNIIRLNETAPKDQWTMETERQIGIYGGDKVNYDHEDFWKALDELVNTSEIVIDRPKGSTHPRFPNFIYRVDYGYLKNTASMDGAGIENCTTSLIRIQAA